MLERHHIFPPSLNLCNNHFSFEILPVFIVRARRVVVVVVVVAASSFSVAMVHMHPREDA